METGNPMEAIMQATLTFTAAARSYGRRDSYSLRTTLVGTLERLRSAIVQGSDHSLWQTSPGATFTLLPRGEQDRLLRSGRL
jgi:hypothetical protein